MVLTSTQRYLARYTRTGPSPKELFRYQSKSYFVQEGYLARFFGQEILIVGKILDQYPANKLKDAKAKAAETGSRLHIATVTPFVCIIFGATIRSISINSIGALKVTAIYVYTPAPGHEESGFAPNDLSYTNGNGKK